MGSITIDTFTSMHVALEGWAGMTVPSFYDEFFVKPCGSPKAKHYKPPIATNAPMTYITFQYYHVQDSKEERNQPPRTRKKVAAQQVTAKKRSRAPPKPKAKSAARKRHRRK